MFGWFRKKKVLGAQELARRYRKNPPVPLPDSRRRLVTVEDDGYDPSATVVALELLSVSAASTPDYSPAEPSFSPTTQPFEGGGGSFGGGGSSASWDDSSSSSGGSYDGGSSSSSDSGSSSSSDSGGSSGGDS